MHRPAASCSHELVCGRSQPGLPGFDEGKAQPVLTGLIESGRLDLPKSGRALVPGCGLASALSVLAVAPVSRPWTAGLRGDRHRFNFGPRYSGGGYLAEGRCSCSGVRLSSAQHMQVLMTGADTSMSILPPRAKSYWRPATSLPLKAHLTSYTTIGTRLVLMGTRPANRAPGFLYASQPASAGNGASR